MKESFFEIEEGEEKIHEDGFSLEYKAESTPSETNENVTVHDVTGSYSQDDIVPVKIMLFVLLSFVFVICITFIIALTFGRKLRFAV